ncbi:MAG TPA: hypothetical protein VFJ97_11735 [Dermatophilaceae bacterium]|nr:hypothetical protein [Dermatophilaceae bacterium]
MGGLALVVGAAVVGWSVARRERAGTVLRRLAGTAVAITGAAFCLAAGRLLADGPAAGVVARGDIGRAPAVGMLITGVAGVAAGVALVRRTSR